MSLSEHPDLSIIIINWNSRSFVQECLKSIYQNADGLRIETIVVDNASFDGCDIMLQSLYPQVAFIQSDDNLGFARANNLGLARSNGKNVLFLNPDTAIQGSALQSMLDLLYSRPLIGMVGARLLNSDRTLQDNCITALPTILNQALGSNFLRRKFPKSWLWGKRAFFNDPEVPAPVEAISGACMLVRREVIDAMQGFDPGYFMYAEDTDLCLRITKAGWQIYYAPDARIIHHAGGSSASREESNFSSIMIRESLTLFFTLHRGTTYAALFRLSCAAAASVRLLVLTLLMLLTIGSARQQRISRAMRKWATIFSWSVGRNAWVMPMSRPCLAASTIAAPKLDKLPESST